MIFPSSTPELVRRVTGLREPIDELVAVCSKPGLSPPLEATLLSCVPDPLAAVARVKGAARPFCFVTGSSFMLSRKRSGMGIGCTQSQQCTPSNVALELTSFDTSYFLSLLPSLVETALAKMK